MQGTVAYNFLIHYFYQTIPLLTKDILSGAFEIVFLYLANISSKKNAVIFL